MKDNLPSFRGYGIIFKKTGWIVTSYHIVSDPEIIEVETISGHCFPVMLYHHDSDNDLAILRPTEIKILFKCVDFIKTEESINIPCASLLLNYNFVVSEGIICKKHKTDRNAITILEICNLGNRDLYNLGGPIIIKNSGKVFGIITRLSAGTNIYSTDTTFGIASDIINVYLSHIERSITDEEHYQLSCIRDKVKLIVQIQANSKLHSVDINNPKVNVLKQDITNYLIDLLLSDHKEILDEARSFVDICAPGSIIFEIHIFVKLKSLCEKNNKIMQICKTLHLRFNENLYPHYGFIDYSSLRVFESWKWFLEWYTALKVNKSSISYMIIDNTIIDLLLSVRLLTEEEYLAVNEAYTARERANKFIEVISGRYPCGIDFITAVLQTKQIIRIADYFKNLKEKVMKMADPYIHAKKRISAESLKTKVSFFTMY